MDTFEIKDEEINVEEIMEKIRENIKERKETGAYKVVDPEKIEQTFSETFCSRAKPFQECETTSFSCDLRNDSYSISSHRPVVGKFLIQGRKLVHEEVKRYVDPVFYKQSEFNRNLAGALNSAKEEINSAKEEISSSSREIEQLKAEIEGLKLETERLRAESKKIKSEIANQVKREVKSSVSAIELDLDNKASLNRILETSIERGHKNLVVNSSGTSEAIDSEISEAIDPEINYYVFEERFRGSRENIRQHQTNFIGYFENCINVLDIGCGRGEFLELAKEKGISARGIDLDEDMVNFCKSKGLNAELKDAIEALDEIDDKSLDGIFISQVVEHLSPDYLIKMLNLCSKKMRYGFYIVVETVNPLSLFSLANFYIDLSHIKPVHPETLRFLINMAGFRDIEAKFLSPVSAEMKLQKLPDFNTSAEESRLMIETCNRNINMLNDSLYGAQDYAIIGKK